MYALDYLLVLKYKITRSEVARKPACSQVEVLLQTKGHHMSLFRFLFSIDFNQRDQVPVSLESVRCQWLRSNTIIILHLILSTSISPKPPTFLPVCVVLDA